MTTSESNAISDFLRSPSTSRRTTPNMTGELRLSDAGDRHIPSTTPDPATVAVSEIPDPTRGPTLNSAAIPIDCLEAGHITLGPVAGGIEMPPRQERELSKSIDESETDSFALDSPTKIRALEERVWQTRHPMTFGQEMSRPIIGSRVGRGSAGAAFDVNASASKKEEKDAILSNLKAILKNEDEIHQNETEKDPFLELVKIVIVFFIASVGTAIISVFAYAEQISWGTAVSALVSLGNTLITIVITLSAVEDVPSTDEDDRWEFVMNLSSSVLNKVIAKRSLYLPLITQVADSATDIGMMVEFRMRANQNQNLPGGTSYESLFWASLSALMIHRIVSTLIVFDRTGRKRDILMQLFDFKIYEVIYISWKYGDTVPSCLQNQLNFFEAILESGPQAVISLYVLIQTDSMTPLVATSTFFSLFFLVLQIFTMDRGHFRDGRGGSEMDLNLKGNFIQCCVWDEQGKEDEKSDEEQENSESLPLTARKSRAASFNFDRPLACGRRRERARESHRNREKICWVNANWLAHLLWRMTEVTWSIGTITCIWVFFGGFWVFICILVLLLPFFAELARTSMYWYRTDEGFFFHSFVVLRSILATDPVEMAFIDQNDVVRCRITPFIRILTVMGISIGNIFIDHPNFPIGMSWVIQILGPVSVFLYGYLGLRRLPVRRCGSSGYWVVHPLCMVIAPWKYRFVTKNWLKNPIGYDYHGHGGLITMKSVRTLNDLKQLHRYTFNMDVNRLNWFKLDDPIEICAFLRTICLRDDEEWRGTQGEEKLSFLQAVFRYSDFSTDRYSKTELEDWLTWMTHPECVNLGINGAPERTTKSAFNLALDCQTNPTLVRLLSYKFGGLDSSYARMPHDVARYVLAQKLNDLGSKEAEKEDEEKAQHLSDLNDQTS